MVKQSTCVFFKQKTAYEMRISDWSSDVCSSDLDLIDRPVPRGDETADADRFLGDQGVAADLLESVVVEDGDQRLQMLRTDRGLGGAGEGGGQIGRAHV